METILKRLIYIISMGVHRKKKKFLTYMFFSTLDETSYVKLRFFVYVEETVKWTYTRTFLRYKRDRKNIYVDITRDWKKNHLQLYRHSTMYAQTRLKHITILIMST